MNGQYNPYSQAGLLGSGMMNGPSHRAMIYEMERARQAMQQAAGMGYESWPAPAATPAAPETNPVLLLTGDDE